MVEGKQPYSWLNFRGGQKYGGACSKRLAIR